MAKARKTRQQKIKAELKRKENPPTQVVSSVQFQLPELNSMPKVVTPTKQITQDIAIGDYKYLSRDLLKTTITVGIVIVAEVILRIVFRNA